MASGCGVFYLCLVTTLTWGILECSDYTSPLRAIKEGDIIIGGIFPIHESVNFTNSIDGRPSPRNCSRYEEARMLQALMLIEAVETINSSPLLGNLTLGYRIMDSCSDVTTAVYVTQRFLDVNRTVCQDVWTAKDRTHQTAAWQPVDVIIGGYHSEISIAMARQLSIHEIPQISYGSTTGLLSDKSRFPAFMRTVPEDRYQAHVIVDILVRCGWNWVGLVTTDGDYGRYIAQRFRERAKEKGVCIAFSTVLPDILGDRDLKKMLNETIANIESDDRIRVIVSFAKPYHMMYVMNALTPNATGRIWLASDNWATSAPGVLQNSPLTLEDIGTVIGVTLKSSTSASFDRYLDNLNPDLAAHANNTILRQYLWWLQTQGQSTAQPGLGQQLRKKVYPYAIFSVGMAVKAIASAVKDLCTHRDCKRGKHFQPWMLKNALRKAKFQWEPKGHPYTFDERGDLNTGYDVIHWRQNGQEVDIIAKYSIESGNWTFMDGAETLIANLPNVTSRCSASCFPGTKKNILKDKEVCCFDCENCAENTFTNATDMEACLHCPDGYWSSPRSEECHKIKKVFFGWTKPFAIVLLSFSALGIVLTLVVLVLFLARWNTPVVRSSVGPVSLLLLLSLLGSFSSTVLFVGEPSDPQCQARQVLFGLSFTLCISCVLAKSLKIVLAFQINPSAKRVLDKLKLFQPYLIIAACMSVQVVICAVWLTQSPPKKTFSPKTGANKNGEVILLCQEGAIKADGKENFLYFSLMLGYMGALSLLGFGIAFQNRKLPDCYNEARFITFGQLIYLICWVVFGPIYAHAEAGEDQPAVEMMVILFSAYGLLGTLFLPKCYVMLFRQEANTKEAFLRVIREHNCRAGAASHQEGELPPEISPSSELSLPMHSSSSQACLVGPAAEAEESNGGASPVTQIHVAHDEAPSPNAPVISETRRDAVPVKYRKKKDLIRCNTVH